MAVHHPEISTPPGAAARLTATVQALPRRAGLLAEIVLAYARAHRELRRAPLATAIERLRTAPAAARLPPASRPDPAARLPPASHLPPASRPDPAARPDAAQELQQARRLGWIVARTLAHLPGDTRCLLRSLVLTRLLAARGISSRLVIGTRTTPEFLAHAWVEHGGEPVLDPGDGSFNRLTEL